MNLRSLTLTYRSMQRMREIVAVLWSHGFHQVLSTSGLVRFLPVSYRVRRNEDPNELALGGPERMRHALQRLGPTFVKLGQMLASRPDLVPEVYAEEFKKLQDHVEPFGFDEVKKVLEEEMSAPLDTVFTSVEEEPLAAASMAQVHRAVLLNGDSVVLKVRRPGIEKLIASDLAVLRLIADAVEHYVPESRSLSLPMIVDEFSRAIKKEIDFYLEASSVERFRRNFEQVAEIEIPRIRWDLTSPRLLVMEEAFGLPANDPAALKKFSKDERHHFAHVIARNFMKQVLEDGLFHADMHAGNVWLTEGGKIVLLDFGSVGSLSENAQEVLGGFFVSLITHDYPGLVEEFTRIGATDGVSDLNAFERDLREMVEPYHGRPLKEVRVGDLLREAVTIGIKHNVKVPPELVLLGRATLTVEGLVRQIDPEIDMVAEAVPYAKRLAMLKMDPRRQFRQVRKMARDYRDLVARLPSQLTKIFQKVLESKLTIEFVHKGYDKALDEMDRSSNRISASLIISAMIVGSSLMVHSGKGPQAWGFPVLGIVGFVFAGVLGLGLAIQILRSGKF